MSYVACMDSECGCVSSVLLRVVVCVIILTRLWPNGYYVYPFQVLIDSPLPRVESDGKDDGGRLFQVSFWDQYMYDYM